MQMFKSEQFVRQIVFTVFTFILSLHFFFTLNRLYLQNAFQSWKTRLTEKFQSYYTWQGDLRGHARFVGKRSGLLRFSVRCVRCCRVLLLVKGDGCHEGRGRRGCGCRDGIWSSVMVVRDVSVGVVVAGMVSVVRVVAGGVTGVVGGRNSTGNHGCRRSSSFWHVGVEVSKPEPAVVV